MSGYCPRTIRYTAVILCCATLNGRINRKESFGTKDVGVKHGSRYVRNRRLLIENGRREMDG